jgi:hypothetical protein
MAKGLSPWIKHVMATKRKMPKGSSLGAAMKKAKSTYKKGGALDRPEGEGEEKVEEEGAAKELGAEAEFEEEEKGGRRRRKTRRHRGGRTRRTRRHR